MYVGFVKLTENFDFDIRWKLPKFEAPNSLCIKGDYWMILCPTCTCPCRTTSCIIFISYIQMYACTNKTKTYCNFWCKSFIRQYKLSSLLSDVPCIWTNFLGHVDFGSELLGKCQFLLIGLPCGKSTDPRHGVWDNLRFSNVCDSLHAGKHVLNLLINLSITKKFMNIIVPVRKVSDMYCTWNVLKLFKLIQIWYL